MSIKKIDFWFVLQSGDKYGIYAGGLHLLFSSENSKEVLELCRWHNEAVLRSIFGEKESDIESYRSIPWAEIIEVEVDLLLQKKHKSIFDNIEKFVTWEDIQKKS